MAAVETGAEGVAQFREVIKNKYEWSQPYHYPAAGFLLLPITRCIVNQIRSENTAHDQVESCFTVTVPCVELRLVG